MPSREHLEKYVPYYCEENIWHLCQHQDFDNIETCDVVFITNERKQFPIFYQRAAISNERFVVWDYHVILITKEKDKGAFVWDLDTTLSFPVPLEFYVKECFLFEKKYAKYYPKFRIIERNKLLSTFTSDRKHMLVKGSDTEYLQPPPAWPCCTPQEVYNKKHISGGDTPLRTLMKIIDFTQNTEEIVTLQNIINKYL